MQAGLSNSEDFKMVPFDVVTGKDMVCISGGVTILCKRFEMLGFPIMQSTFGFTDIEGIAVLTAGIVF